MSDPQWKTYAAGATIFHEGDIAYSAFLLKSGKVEISTINDGQRVHLATIQPNQLFGELALIDNSPRSATAIAVEASKVMVVKQEYIEHQLGDLDEFMKYWLEYLTERVRALSKRVDK